MTLYDWTRFSQPPEGGVKDFTVQTGLQVLQASDAGIVTSSSFDTLVGGGAGRIADARLGVYIHAYGDRISHHVCLDDSYLYGPTKSGTEWTADMTSGNCEQGLHSIRHIWETGTNYKLLLSPDRTTIAYLGDALQELGAFAKARGVLSKRATDTSAVSALVTDLTNAESTQGVSARLAALRTVTCSLGLAPFPGEPACPDAGTSGGKDGGSDSGAPKGDAGHGQTPDSGAPADGGSNEPPPESGTGGGCSLAEGGGAFSFAGAFMALTAAGAFVARRRAKSRAAG